VLLAAPFGALSVAMALTARRMESVIGAVNFLLLPLTFLLLGLHGGGADAGLDARHRPV
jgi:hypothetical protein